MVKKQTNTEAVKQNVLITVMQQISSRAGNNLLSLPNSSSYLLYGPCCTIAVSHSCLRLGTTFLKNALNWIKGKDVRFLFSPNQWGYQKEPPKLPAHPQPPLAAQLSAIPSCTPCPLPWGISFLQKSRYHHLPFTHPRFKELFASVSQRAYWTPYKFLLSARRETMSSRRSDTDERGPNTEKTREQHQHWFPLSPQQPCCCHLLLFQYG